MSIAFPGYVSDVHSADLLDPAWGNAIRDRAMQVFDTTTNRDAAITAPQTGQVGVLTTLSTAGLYIRHGATVGWVAPWNLPWGIIAKATSTSAAQTSITSEVDITSMSVTFTALANRQYQVEGVVPLSGTANDTARAKITDGSNAQIAEDQVTFGVSASAYMVQPQSIETYSAGSITRKLRALRQAGSGGNVTVAGGTAFVIQLLVTDIGPTGAPS